MEKLDQPFTRISNEILENLYKSDLSAAELKIILYIIRKTYGIKGSKKTYKTQRQMEQEMEMTRATFKRSFYKLIARGMIVKNKDRSYAFEKSFESWKKVSKMIPDKRYQKRYQKVSKMIPKGIKNDTDYIGKETIKETYKEKKIYIYRCSSFFEQIWSEYPSKIGKKRAFKSYQATVKTENDFANIKKAMTNYKQSKRVKDGFIQNGSTWFANWEDWINYSEKTKKPAHGAYAPYQKPDWQK